MERDYTQFGSGSASNAIAQGIDAGLRGFMIRVYNYMMGALALTGIIAYYVGNNQLMVENMAASGFMWVILLAPIGLVLFLSFRLHAISLATAQFVFWLFAGLIGLSLAPIFQVFTQESIARTFFITAGTFGGMSLLGYTTKRDLTSMGSFLIMGVWGLILASLVNIFVGSTALGFAISVLGVLIFTGLTAYDTQKIKESYFADDSADFSGKKAIIGALNLYMDFINIFIQLLRLMGDRR
ncbi:MAG: Bax inhibitor-1/YccA family protein [Alphaproteobacteria bacterium]|nr:MAG: Bax inhibitor-1/YccA family protein [Alphaproteobacteria bacterium]